MRQQLSDAEFAGNVGKVWRSQPQAVASLPALISAASLSFRSYSDKQQLARVFPVAEHYAKQSLLSTFFHRF